MRQGDPLSPLFFTLVMEYLSRLFLNASKDPSFRFHPLCKQDNLTNLAFADDLLLFCKGHDYSVAKMTKVLELFERTAGLQANPAKSSIYMGGLSIARQNRLLQLTGYQKGEFPLRYLGFSLSTSRWTMQDCHMLVDKVTMRLRS